jgi:hypothetical protein
MENNIKIVRLQNGEDIMGCFTANNENFDVSEPMAVHVEHNGKEAGLMMRHWLPVQLIKKNEITLEHKDILCVLEPSEEFCEYYLNTVEKIKALLKAKTLVDNMNNEEVNDIMDAFEEMNNNGNLLH